VSTTIGPGAAADKLPPFIGRYRVVDRIGRGAMGVVYAAEDETLGRRVAVKVMMGDLEDEPEMRGRFFREARITGQLAHRNIVTVFDLGEEDGHPFIVMELLKGMPLAEHLATPAGESLDARIDIMMQICEGLQAAHSKGVVHRDVKPSNLFVQHDGSVKILDFGVARLASSNLTKSGFLVGTPEYMSPEQAQGRPVDARSDVFSAAGVFYFMLTGRGPFSSPDLPKMLRAVIHEDPPPLTDAQAPEVLRRTLTKALAKSPNDRYQQCAELQADLAKIRRTHETASHRVVLAAFDRYRQVLATIEERRALGQSLGRPDVERSAAQAAARLEARFPEFARHTDARALVEPMDPVVAQSALSSLQSRHNAEQASLAALRMEAADSLARTSSAASDRSTGMQAAADGDDASSGSLKDRAAALWRRLGGT
jgi:eukaryotic-like serine/threonine-protein kinase